MASMKEQLEEFLDKMGDPLAEDTQNMTGLVYGESGGGKTVFALRLAKAIAKANKTDERGGKVLMLDAVNAWRSLKNHPELHDGTIIRRKYEGKSQIDLLNTALELDRPEFRQFSVVVLDEASSMTDHDGDVVLEARSAADRSKDPDVLTQPDMGATTERMRRSITKLLKQNISVIFIAHQRQDEDKNVGYKVTRPRFMPKFSGTLREGLDFVIYMTATPEVNGSEIKYVRKLQCNPTKTTVAKTRIGGLGLYATPDEFIATAIPWMKGEGTDNTVDVVINDKVDNTSENLDDDFGGIQVD